MLALCLLCLALAVCQSSTQPPPSTGATKAVEIHEIQAQAEAGDSDAQFRLGQAYALGSGVRQDDTQAVTWYRKAAEQGNSAAENSLGVMYLLGRGVEKNKEEAVRWYHKAAKLGSGPAMFNLGVSYYNGEGGNEYYVLAYAWFLLAREAGNSAAGDAVRRSETELDESSQADANLRIGEMYEKGEELPQSYSDAARWYRNASGRNSEARLRLAQFLINGTGGLQKDYDEAMRLCRVAANKGSGPAQYCVGFLYQSGLGVTANLSEAAKWYQEAANSGSGKAGLVLANMYLKGDGVPIDRPQAYYLLLLAYRNGVVEAKAQAHALRPEMNAKEAESLQKKLHQKGLDPQKVYAAIDDPAPPDAAHTRHVLRPVKPN